MKGGLPRFRAPIDAHTYTIYQGQKMQHLLTVEDIVQDMQQHIDDDDKTFFATAVGLDQVLGEMSLGRWVRNRYGLWNDHPLTRRWRRDGPNDMRDGVDYSQDHPDNISRTIVQAFFATLPKSENQE